MKSVRTVLGVKKIEEKDHHMALLQLRELLDAHRNMLINRLIADLPAYLDYKFNSRVNQKQLESLKDKLSFMKNSSVDMDKYDFIFQHMMANDSTYVSSEPFYREIDENISWYLNEAQLKLVR
ncbi:MAG TPA: hypothetical protein VK666_29745 [Chryseolinea sp.]|nr:hypothetical protein [Chryseolinea sp.]